LVVRVSFVSIFMVFALAFALLSIATAHSQDACRCTGCGCKGGPGWRGPEGTCISKAKLSEICGEPAGAPCTLEAATRVCFGTPFGGATQEGETQAP